jgi:hypothetical protein
LKKNIICFATLLVLSMLLSVPFVLAKPGDVPRGPPVHVNDNDPGSIYVSSQEMYYYTIVPYAGGNLVYNGHNGGSFQQLFTTGPNAPYTEVGPGNVGYRGGRWWIDNGPDDHTGNGVMDPDDTYFLCPLTLKAPGR